jgi:hypothetical protein
MLSFNRRVLRILEESGLVAAPALAEAGAAAGRGDNVTTLLLEKKAVGEGDLLGVLARQQSRELDGQHGN